MIQVAYAFVWWLLLVIIGLAAFPLVSRVCGGLADRGYGISKLLGLLLITYFSWILSSARIVGFGYANISLAFLLLLAVSLFVGRKHLSFRNLPWRSILTTEALFAAAFILFLVFLRSKPDLFFRYSEDFMDFAFLQSVLRSGHFPPADPWLAGASLPYYYGGQLLVAILTMLSRVPASISYNLGVAMFFALAVSASYGLGYGLTRRRVYGLVSAAFVCLLGYLSGAFQLAAYVSDSEVMGHVEQHWPSFVKWLQHYELSAGVIPHTGNTYPYYAFLQGDLHAHTVSIPFQVMFITIVFALVKRGGRGEGASTWVSPLNILVLGASLGFFALVNTWEYPTYAALAVLAFLLLRRDLTRKDIAALAGVVGLSALLYLPYFISRGSTGIEGLGLVGARTDLIDFVELFGLLLFVILSFFCVLSARRTLGERVAVLSVALMIVVALLAYLWGFQLVLLLVPLIVGCCWYMLRAQSKPETRFALLLILMGALLALFCEVIYVSDAYSDPWERYNTVMKLYLQVWVLLAIGSAYGVFWVRRKLGRRLRAAWTALLLVFVIAAAIQPIGLTVGWASGQRDLFSESRGTLDGLAYVEERDPGAYEAILWLNEHVHGSPVILEAPGGAYEFTSVISTMTGLPTVVGWVTHEVMWQGGWDNVAGRDSDVDMIYQTTDEAEAGELLEKYAVEYIYVGAQERERYEEQGLEKFAQNPQSYELIFEAEGSRVYHVVPK